jgi:hypothetical protein
MGENNLAIEDARRFFANGHFGLRLSMVGADSVRQAVN